jgi:hypothetical protein
VHAHEDSLVADDVANRGAPTISEQSGRPAARSDSTSSVLPPR